MKMTKVPLQESVVMGSSWHADSPSGSTNRRVVGMEVASFHADPWRPSERSWRFAEDHGSHQNVLGRGAL